MQRVTLEFGGTSPNLIFADCNLERAIDEGIDACFINLGQSGDPSRALRVAKAPHYGTVNVNGAYLAAGSPFGGYKSPGNWRESLRDCLEVKAIALPGSRWIRSRVVTVLSSRLFTIRPRETILSLKIFPKAAAKITASQNGKPAVSRLTILVCGRSEGHFSVHRSNVFQKRAATLNMIAHQFASRHHARPFSDRAPVPERKRL